MHFLIFKGSFQEEVPKHKHQRYGTPEPNTTNEGVRFLKSLADLLFSKIVLYRDPLGQGATKSASNRVLEGYRLGCRGPYMTATTILTGPKPNEIKAETFRIDYLIRDPKVEKLSLQPIRSFRGDSNYSAHFNVS